MKLIKYSLLSLFLMFSIASLPARASDHGVILIYHHVSESTPASTSISPDNFKNHLNYLKSHHTVVPLADMINTLQSSQPLPANAVAITFDDGYKNIFENAHPLLSAFNFPYTVFINPPLIGNRGDQLTWQQVKQMQTDGVVFANHTLYHDHLLKRQENENHSQWLSRVKQDIEQAQSMLTQQLGDVPKWLAYPYGEFSKDISELIQEMGYVGFAQHSGPVASYSDFSALPRFAAAGIYANLDTLKVKLKSMAMPVLDTSRKDPLVSASNAQPVQVLTLDTRDLTIGQVNCFIDGSHMNIERTSSTLIIKPPKTLQPGRTRINCTVPSISKPNRFYWYSQPWFMPSEDGSWLN